MSIKCNIELAGLRFGVVSQFDHTEFFGDFKVQPGKCDVEIAVLPEDIEKEQTQNGIADPYQAELLVIHRKTADILPVYGGCVCHGVAVSYGGAGYMFCGRSGAGKTTHASVWEKNLGDKLTIINGDKPILRVYDGKIVLYSSPWAGKENRKTNTSAPLCGICFIKQGKTNITSDITGNCVTNVLGQVYLPRDGATLKQTLGIVDRLLSCVPVYEIECDISDEAFRSSFDVLTKRKRI